MSTDTVLLENFAPSIGVNHFGFSGVGMEDLESAEYTLVTVVVDETGSVM